MSYESVIALADSLLMSGYMQRIDNARHDDELRAFLAMVLPIAGASCEGMNALWLKWNSGAAPSTVTHYRNSDLKHALHLFKTDITFERRYRRVLMTMHIDG